ncbi:hypothetical protein Scep_016620 [Stephania cephalantha]|uniref:Bulb-type lectin domain-containing protein n=1 Tax=Stephania cephalantha TaxID=152367 RepID=A0AAP0IN58_9MAGN
MCSDGAVAQATRSIGFRVDADGRWSEYAVQRWTSEGGEGQASLQDGDAVVGATLFSMERTKRAECVVLNGEMAEMERWQRAPASMMERWQRTCKECYEEASDDVQAAAGDFMEIRIASGDATAGDDDSVGEDALARTRTCWRGSPPSGVQGLVQRQQADRWRTVANIEYPLRGAYNSSCFFYIKSRGNLEISDGRGMSYAFTSQSVSANTSATLLDSGNLVLRDIENSNMDLWQSFNYPSDYFLPGMKLGFNLRTGRNWSLTSWRSAEDPAHSAFSTLLDSSLEFFVMKGSQNCSEDALPFCKCLQGFEAYSLVDWNQSNWSKGCVRRTTLQCGENDQFILMKQVELPTGKKETVSKDLLSYDFNTKTDATKPRLSDNSNIVSGGRWDVDLPLFSLNSVSSSTDEFSNANKIGQGGFGPVYKGKLLNGQEAAIKRFSQGSGQGMEELKNEAWKLWKSERVLELIDPTLGDSFSISMALRCINVGLLCVQEQAVDRPTMSDVVMMLNNEATALSSPNQPVFCPRSDSGDSNVNNPIVLSVNNMTFSVMEAR